MSRIQKTAFGLLGTFDAKTQGRNPPEFSDVIQLTYDLNDNYEFPLSFEQVSDNTVAAGGSFAILTVPDTELWIVKSIGSFVGLLAGAVSRLSFVPRIIFPGTAVQTAWATTTQYETLTGFRSVVNNTRILLPPGSIIHTHVQELVGAAPTLAVNTQAVVNRVNV